MSGRIRGVTRRSVYRVGAADSLASHAGRCAPSGLDALRVEGGSDPSGVEAKRATAPSDPSRSQARDATAPTAASGVDPHVAVETEDEVAIEEPLELRVAGETVAITLRTPGEDERLALGFLLAEGLISGAADVGSIAHCGRPGEAGFGNVIELVPASGATRVFERLDATRRGSLTTAACGVCGRRTIDDLLARIPRLESSATIDVEVLLRAPLLLREGQGNFDRTGGVHAAAAFDLSAATLHQAEDIGRHNAVDKVVGALVQRDLLGQAALLAVSGRAGFEIVQKAAMARIPCVVSVGAASSLAIDLAARAGITLAAFVRDGRMNLYTHADRIRRRT